MPLSVLHAEVNTQASFRLPAGTYWIGDPCYIFNNHDDAWMRLLDSCAYFDLPLGRVVDRTGAPHSILASSTRYGDGTYSDDAGEYQFGVDSGLIGITTLDTAHAFAGPTSCLSHGCIVTFDAAFTVEFDGEGDMHFGHIHVATGDEEDGLDD